MSNFLIFKAAFNNSATPAIGTYTAEGAAAKFYKNTSISPDYYLYNTVLYSAVQWFVPTAETTDFEFVADILTRYWDNRLTYFIIADSAGTTRLRMWSVNDNWHFENSDSITTSGTEYIGTIGPSTSGGFGIFHQFRVRVRKLTASSSGVEVYVDGTLKLTATAGAALITCAKIGFVGGVNSFGPGTGAGIKNAYLYDLSGGDVIDRGVLSGAFNRFISWMKSKFALKSDIPTVNDAALTIQRNGVNVQTFTANQSTAATANITVPTAVSELTNDSGYLTASSNLDASKLTSGTVDIARLPQGALERLVKVANEAARYALTTADVQLGDTVQQLDTGIMYIVTDADHLDSAAGYTEYTAGTAASVPWSGVTGKPTFAAVATSGAYSDLTGTPTIPTVNNATLTIQKNGTNVQTFTANQSTNATANITVPTKTSDLTNDSGFITEDDTKIPLAGSNLISGDLVPSTDGTVNLGSPSYQWNNAYIKSLTINGVACGDILTHNASEFVDVSSNQTIGGIKAFSNIIYSLGSQIILRRNDVERTVLPASIVYTAFSFNDKSGVGNNSRFSAVENVVKTNGDINLDLRAYDFSTKSNTHTTAVLERKYDGTSSFYPEQNNTVNLGTSTNKWKSFNGISPDELGLPTSTYTDVSSYITHFDSTPNVFTAPVSGLFFIDGSNLSNSVSCTVTNNTKGYSTNFVYAYGHMRGFIPVEKGDLISAFIDIQVTVESARIYHLKGKV